MWLSSMHPCIEIYLVLSTCVEDLTWNVRLEIALERIIWKGLISMVSLMWETKQDVSCTE
uniref:Uncharacterized protein n=1 Tax=Arundo donax TaxID=35708 RepID=A0A0A9H8W4_ARUDO